MSGLLIGLISAIHVLVCLALTITILLQSGKGGGLAGAFGGGSSQTLFGGRGAATFLSRATTVLAVIFFVTSLTLGVTSSHAGGTQAKSLIQEEAKRRAEQRAATQGATGTPQPSEQPSAGAPSNAPPAATPVPPAAGNGTSAPTGGTK
ncbi:MAG: preprotein translocase subunit SecG [Hyphomicrobiales bacterium]